MTSETISPTAGMALPPPPRGPASPRLLRSGIVIAAVVVGAIGGAGASHLLHRPHPQSVLLLQPTPIAKVTGEGPVAVKGQVAEVFGNKFILQDDTGRTLVDTGPRGEGGKPVVKGDAVTVQGRFDNGFLRASVLTRADGTSEAFGPPPHPHPDRGPGGDRGPGREPPPARPAP